MWEVLYIHSRGTPKSAAPLNFTLGVLGKFLSAVRNSLCFAQYLQRAVAWLEGSDEKTEEQWAYLARKKEIENGKDND
jgi:hypothetical protein